MAYLYGAAQRAWQTEFPGAETVEVHHAEEHDGGLNRAVHGVKDVHRLELSEPVYWE